MELEEFKDRISKNPNRRTIKVISQSADEILADIDYADAAIETGTSINAEKMNIIRNSVQLAERDAGEAKAMAVQASTIVSQVNTKADTALQNAQIAMSTADTANNKASEALTQVVQLQGTKVMENGVLLTEFNADTKVDKAAYETRLANLENDLRNSAEVGLELGKKDGTAATPHIDFHTDGGTATEYNARIIASDNQLTITSQEINLSGTVVLSGTLVI